MGLHGITQVRETVMLMYRGVRRYASGVPVKAWAILGLFLLTAILMALHTALSVKNSTLHLKLQHEFRKASVSVWVDDNLAYSGEITGSTKKKFGLFPTDSAQGSLSQIIPVRSGQHNIRLRIEPEAATMQEDNIVGTFADHTTHNLAVTARHSGLSLSWQVQNTVSVEGSSMFGWLSQYAGALILTIVGSIMSALTGYAIKELPVRLRSASDSTPKTGSPSSVGLSVD